VKIKLIYLLSYNKIIYKSMSNNNNNKYLVSIKLKCKIE